MSDKVCCNDKKYCFSLDRAIVTLETDIERRVRLSLVIFNYQVHSAQSDAQLPLQTRRHRLDRVVVRVELNLAGAVNQQVGGLFRVTLCVSQGTVGQD
jgi:hypothetical protein